MDYNGFIWACINNLFHQKIAVNSKIEIRNAILGNCVKISKSYKVGSESLRNWDMSHWVTEPRSQLVIEFIERWVAERTSKNTESIQIGSVLTDCWVFGDFNDVVDCRVAFFPYFFVRLLFLWLIWPLASWLQRRRSSRRWERKRWNRRPRPNDPIKNPLVNSFFRDNCSLSTEIN